MTKLVIHVGGQKCGSSALQGYLFHGRRKLAAKGLYYIDRHLGLDLDECESHNRLLGHLRNLPDGEVEKRARFLGAQAEGKTLVLSSEGFCSVRQLDQHARKLALICAHVNPEIHIYVRSQLNVIYSGWHQWGLQRGMSFQEWVDHALDIGFADWNRIIAKYEQAIPNAVFHVHVYDRHALIDGDIVRDFVLKAAIPLVETTSTRRNLSISVLTAQVLSEISEERGVDLARVIQILKKSAPAWAVGDTRNFVCPDKTASAIKERYLDGNEELFRRYNLPMRDRLIFHGSSIARFERLQRDELARVKLEAEQFLRDLPLR